jgi:hypothetical protein
MKDNWDDAKLESMRAGAKNKVNISNPDDSDEMVGPCIPEDHFELLQQKEFEEEAKRNEKSALLEGYRRPRR